MESLTYPADVAPLYDDLLNCIRTNDQQGVRRVFDELDRAKRPVAEVLGVMKSLSKTGESQQAHETPLQNSTQCGPPSVPQQDPPELPYPAFSLRAFPASPADAAVPATSVLDECPGFNLDIAGAQSTPPLTSSALLASDSVGEETNSEPENASSSLFYNPDRGADQGGSEARPDGDVYGTAEPLSPPMLLSSVKGSGCAAPRTARGRLYGAVVSLFALGVAVPLLLTAGIENIGAETMRRIEETLTRGRELSFSGGAAADPNDVAVASQSEHRSEILGAAQAVPESPGSPVTEPGAALAPEPPMQPAVQPHLPFPGESSVMAPDIREHLDADQPGTKSALPAPEGQPKMPQLDIASATPAEASAGQADAMLVVTGSEPLAQRADSIGAAPDEVAPAVPSRNEQPALAVIQPAFSRAGPVASAPALVSLDQGSLNQGKSTMSAPKEPGGREAETLWLVERGDRLFGLGDIASARLFYERAADAGDGQAALRLGETFDPAFLQRINRGSIQADLATATSWYRRAGELGASEAQILMMGTLAKQDR